MHKETGKLISNGDYEKLSDSEKDNYVRVPKRMNDSVKDAIENNNSFADFDKHKNLDRLRKKNKYGTTYGSVSNYSNRKGKKTFRGFKG